MVMFYFNEGKEMSKLETKYSKKTKIREIIFDAYFDGNLDMESVITRLNVSRRQFFRLKQKYIDKKLKHGLCGKHSNNAFAVELKDKALDLYKTRYLNFNYEHASELMWELDGIKVGSDSLRGWLLDSGITKPRRKQPKKYQRRDPKDHFNEMLQLDGTFGYFLNDGVKYCLMHLVDDATKTSMAYLYNAEGTFSALDILYRWCCKYGVPHSIYTDRHSTYKVNESHKLTIEEELAGKKIPLTGFGEVCERLNIKQIYAYSPQAKGRVERKHTLYKDRFVKELKLFGITTLDTANEFLLNGGGFTERLNKKFTIEPKVNSSKFTIHINPEKLLQLFTLNKTRNVRNDYTVSFNNVVYQLSRKAPINCYSKVIVKQHALDKSVTIWVGNIKLDYTIVDNYVRPEKEKVAQTSVASTRRKTYTPPEDHPFRQYIPEKQNRQKSSSRQLELLGRYYS